jgi:AmpE protein
LPPVIVSGLLISNQEGFWGLLLEFGFSVVILSWSLGPQSISDRHSNLNDSNQDSKQLISYSYQAYYAPLIWFFLLGPVAALAYRIIYYQVAQLQQSSSQYAAWNYCLMVFDWLPVRLTGLIFLLAGDFIKGLDKLKSYLFELDTPAADVINEIACAAVSDDTADPDDRPDALVNYRKLVERGLITLMVIIGLTSIFHQ